jgi:hypothetical protein
MYRFFAFVTGLPPDGIRTGDDTRVKKRCQERTAI